MIGSIAAHGDRLLQRFHYDRFMLLLFDSSPLFTRSGNFFRVPLIDAVSVMRDRQEVALSLRWLAFASSSIAVSTVILLAVMVPILIHQALRAQVSTS